VERQMKIVDWIKQVQDDLRKLLNFEHTSLASVRKHCQIPNHIALFDTIFAFENYPVDKKLAEKRAEALTIKSVKGYQESNYALTAECWKDSQVWLRLVYDSGLFTKDKICRIAERYLRVLTEIIEFPSESIVGDLLEEGEVALTTRLKKIK